VAQGSVTWIGTEDGLYQDNGGKISRHPKYGVEGPHSNQITGLAVDGRGTLWVATPAGLSSRSADGRWTAIRGRQGLPWEELTSISVAGEGDVWIGSTRGLIL